MWIYSKRLQICSFEEVHTISWHRLRTSWDKMFCSLQYGHLHTFNWKNGIFKLPGLFVELWSVLKLINYKTASYFSISTLLTGKRSWCEAHQAFRCQAWQQERNSTWRCALSAQPCLELLWMQMCQCWSIPKAEFKRCGFVPLETLRTQMCFCGKLLNYYKTDFYLLLSCGKLIYRGFKMS